MRPKFGARSRKIAQFVFIAKIVAILRIMRVASGWVPGATPEPDLQYSESGKTGVAAPSAHVPLLCLAPWLAELLPACQRVRRGRPSHEGRRDDLDDGDRRLPRLHLQSQKPCIKVCCACLRWPCRLPVPCFATSSAADLSVHPSPPCLPAFMHPRARSTHTNIRPTQTQLRLYCTFRTAVFLTHSCVHP